MECPKCGCDDIQIIIPARPGTWWSSGKGRCRHCGHTVAIRAADTPPPPDPEPTPATMSTPPPEPQVNGGAVIYRPIRCPKCGSTKTRITSTRRPIRQHKCQDCGHTFKSIEQVD